MKPEKRRTEIYFETHSITTIRIKGGTSLSAFCDYCQTNVAVFTPEQIAAFLRLTLAEVCRRVETDELHLIENRRGVECRDYCLNRRTPSHRQRVAPHLFSYSQQNTESIIKIR